MLNGLDYEFHKNECVRSWNQSLSEFSWCCFAPGRESGLYDYLKPTVLVTLERVHLYFVFFLVVVASKEGYCGSELN